MGFLLKENDEVRIIAPSRSLNIIDKYTINLAEQRLKNLNLRVSYGKNVYKMDEDYKCASISERVEDLMEAFLDKNVKAILTVIGGYNSNQLLKYIDYDVIKKNPKIFCGYSDITALSNAIYAKTGMVTFYGPHFSSFGMKHGFDYTLEYFKKMFFEDKEINIKDSKLYSSDDKWYAKQDEREFLSNEGMQVLTHGVAEGQIIGGNLNTFVSLVGSEFMPSFKNKILFLENVDLTNGAYLEEFDRNFEILLLQEQFKEIKGIVFGKTQLSANMNIKKWEKMLKSKNLLNKIPIICNCNFGHTTPIFTFPIGGNVKIDTYSSDKKIVIRS